MSIEDMIEEAKQNRRFFQYNGSEWKIEREETIPFASLVEPTQKIVIFANDGFGDYLFVNEGSQEVYQFFHEDFEVIQTDEQLEQLIGVSDYPPSTDDYPAAIYEDGTEVMLGDSVQFKVWVEFWKGWQEGQVVYVPGVSKKENEYEYNGLKEIGIKGNNVKFGVIADPETGKVKKIRLLHRVNQAQ